MGRLKQARKPRADSARNRQLLIDAAKAGFAEVGLNVSLEEIARRAGVGTLYRHFPSREAVVEAVYRREVEQLVEAVPQLLETSPAGEALHQWMHLFVNYIATKRLIAPSLGAAIARNSGPHATTAELITRAISTLVKSAVRSGEVRKDIDPSDLLRALVGVSYGNPAAGWEANARRPQGSWRCSANRSSAAISLNRLRVHCTPRESIEPPTRWHTQSQLVEAICAASLSRQGDSPARSNSLSVGFWRARIADPLIRRVRLLLLRPRNEDRRAGIR
jgi:AcrR family transcriptional regulator